MFAALGCGQRSTLSATSSASSSASAAPPPSAEALDSGAPHPGSDKISPVYPIDHQPPLPEAERYCDVVLSKLSKKEEECCSFPAFVPLGECVRTLSYALRAGAVRIDGAALEACDRAILAQTGSCDWILGTSVVRPSECLGIIQGTLKEGDRCRSSLECLEGARCLGLGATEAGKCAPPIPDQNRCNVSTDTLASFTGQDDFDRHHPECAGVCNGARCVPAPAIDAHCTSSHECGATRFCAGGKCESALPAHGAPCTDLCAGTDRCSHGICATPKGEGEECEEDVDCRAHCERAKDAKSGRCAKLCPSLALPTGSARPK